MTWASVGCDFGSKERGARASYLGNLARDFGKVREVFTTIFKSIRVESDLMGLASPLSDQTGARLESIVRKRPDFASRSQ